MTSPRVLVISFLPPTRGGIATWTGILRAKTATAAGLISFESVGTGSGDRATILSKGIETSRLVGRLILRAGGRRPDIVHVNCCLSPLGLWRDLLVGLLALAARIPLIVHYRGSLPDVYARLPAHSRRAFDALTSIASLNIAVTRDSEVFLRGRGAAAEALPNFIEDEWLDFPRRDGRSDRQQRTRAVYVGRLSSDKGTEDLLRVARALPGVDFVLIGDIADDAEDGLASAPSNVRLAKHQSRPRVMESLLSSDLFVFPSRREGFPNAVLEAMAAGLPVVSTRVGAIPEMIEENAGGFLVAPGDVDAMVRAVRRIAADLALASRMGAYNRRRCRERFVFSRVFERLLETYENLARPKTRADARAFRLRAQVEALPGAIRPGGEVQR